MKVLFHVDEEDKWEMTLANVKNFLHEEKEANLSVVANGPAVKYYTDMNKLEFELKEKVDFVACNNAMKGHGIKLEQIDKSIRIVNAGVVEIAKKQFEGYAYIRP